jgi:hypothetical protein
MPIVKRLRGFALAILAVALFSSCASTGFPPPKERFVSSTARIQYDSVVSLMVLCPDGKIYGGSGFAISERTFITALHVVECGGMGPIATLVETRDGTVMMAIPDKLPESGADAIRMVVGGGKLKVWTRVSARALAIDEPVCAFTGLRMSKKCGYVIGKWGDDMLVGDMRVIPGDSGSAVYDTAGNVVAILVAAPRNNEFQMIAVPAAQWMDLLRE